VTLTLLTRAYCHLCDEMLEALRPLAAAHAASIRVVDVDADASLEAAFGDDVPVLFAGDPRAARSSAGIGSTLAVSPRCLPRNRKRPAEVAPRPEIR
jgi:thioredoxin reductase (NADPH)